MKMRWSSSKSAHQYYRADYDRVSGDGWHDFVNVSPMFKVLTRWLAERILSESKSDLTLNHEQKNSITKLAFSRV